MRIDEVKTLPHQRLLVVKNHAVQVDKRLRVDEHANIAVLEDAVAIPRLSIEADVITQAGTAAALHTQAQSALHAMLGELFADFVDSFRSYSDHF